MSTRCQVSFHYGDDTLADALLYHHTDGYPDFQLKNIIAFLEKTKEAMLNMDSDLWNPEMVAGFFVLLSAGVYGKPGIIPHEYVFNMPIEEWNAKSYKERDEEIGGREPAYQPCTTLHGDIEYLYRVRLSYKADPPENTGNFYIGSKPVWTIEIYDVPGFDEEGTPKLNLLGKVSSGDDVDEWIAEWQRKQAEEDN